MPPAPKKEEVAAVRGTVEGLATVKPPARRRDSTPSLPLELRQAIRENITNKEWLSNGEAYADKKAASSDARVYRRDTARMLQLTDSDIRTRVWENTDEYGDEDGTWSFGIRLKAEGDATEGDDEPGDDVPPDDADDKDNKATDDGTKTEGE